MSDKIPILPILPELPVGAEFKIKGSKERFKVVEVDAHNVLYGGYSVCDMCAFAKTAGRPKDPRCNSFVCAGLDRRDRTYVRAERVEEEE